MDIHKLKEVRDETEQISKIYEVFHEEARLNGSKAARVEFLTTVRYIEQYLAPDSKILDIGAGAGEYSLYFAKKGYQVSAVELAAQNIKAFQDKITSECPVALMQGNAMDLSAYADKSFDVVLLFGPLYHLHKEADRQNAFQRRKEYAKIPERCFLHLYLMIW